MVHINTGDANEDISKPIIAIYIGDVEDAEGGMLSDSPSLYCDLNNNFTDEYSMGFYVDDGIWRDTLLEAQQDLLISIFNKLVK